MKILIVSNIFPPYVIGGYELGAAFIAEELRHRGNKVVVATCANELRDIRPNFDMSPLAKLDVRHVFLPFYRWMSPSDIYWKSNPQYVFEAAHKNGGYVEANCYALKHLIETEKPEVVYFFNPTGLGPMGLMETALSFAGVKVVLHLMDRVDQTIKDAIGMLSLGGKWELIKAQVHAISCSKMIQQQNEGAVFAQNGYLIEKWLDLSGKKSKQTAAKGVLGLPERNKFASHKVIFNGADTKKWKAQKNKKVGEVVRIAYWGRLVPEKGIHTMVALAGYMKKNSKQKIVMDVYGTGEPAYVERIKKEIAAGGLEDVVRLKGFVNPAELPEVVADYDVALCLLWAAEPFAFAPVEGVLAGLYTITVKDTTAAEVWGRDSALALESREDLAAMTRLLERIGQNDQLLAGERERMYQVAKHQLDLKQHIVPQIEQHLKQLPGSRGADVEVALAYARQWRLSPDLQTAILGGMKVKMSNKRDIRYWAREASTK